MLLQKQLLNPPLDIACIDVLLYAHIIIYIISYNGYKHDDNNMLVALEDTMIDTFQWHANLNNEELRLYFSYLMLCLHVLNL